MRIVFLAVDDEFAGIMQKYIYEAHPEWIVGSVIADSPIYKKSKVSAAIFVLRRCGLIYAIEMFRMKVVRKVMRRSPVATPSKLARAHGVELWVSSNINNDASRAKLSAWAPDFIVSTNFNHYIGQKVRSIATAGTWNVHKSLLPHYRGMAPTFHALLNGETEVGITIHRIAEGFDTGDIIAQRRVAIEEEDGVYELNLKTSEAGGRLLLELFESSEPAAVQSVPQPAGDWPNYSYPTPGQVREFLRKGCRF